MKKKTAIPLILATLALLCWGVTSPALAYYPPLQDVTDPVVVQGATPSVSVSVHNPATGQDIPYTWRPFDGTGPFVINQVIKMQGIVAWRIKDTANNQYMVVFAAYDPGWAALMNNPQAGWQSFQTYPWTADDTNIIAVNDGVLVYESKAIGPIGSKTTITVGAYTFDPGGWYEEFWHGWMPYGWRGSTFTMTNYSALVPYSYAVKDGVAAFLYNDSVSNAVYDAHQTFGFPFGWQLDAWYDAPNATNLQITNATVTWTDDSGDQRRGYDYVDQTFKTGMNTKVMSSFRFWPSPGKPGQWVYFTDMSIAATAWNWSMGDLATSTARSLYHKYANAGDYLAYLQVTGPAGTDASTQTVPVKAPVCAGPIQLLLLN